MSLSGPLNQHRTFAVSHMNREHTGTFIVWILFIALIISAFYLSLPYACPYLYTPGGAHLPYQPTSAHSSLSCIAHVITLDILNPCPVICRY